MSKLSVHYNLLNSEFVYLTVTLARRSRLNIWLSQVTANPVPYTMGWTPQTSTSKESYLTLTTAANIATAQQSNLTDKKILGCSLPKVVL